MNMEEQGQAVACPFCGAADHIDTHEGSTFRWMLAECGDCGAQGPEVRVQTLGEGTPEQWVKQGHADAIAEWNRRAALAVPPQAEPVTMLTEALESFDERLTQWAGAYPLSAFPEPDFFVVNEALKSNGLTLDSVSASNMRHVVTTLNELFEPVRAAVNGLTIKDELK